MAVEAISTNTKTGANIVRSLDSIYKTFDTAALVKTAPQAVPFEPKQAKMIIGQ